MKPKNPTHRRNANAITISDGTNSVPTQITTEQGIVRKKGTSFDGDVVNSVTRVSVEIPIIIHFAV